MVIESCVLDFLSWFWDCFYWILHIKWTISNVNIWTIKISRYAYRRNNTSFWECCLSCLLFRSDSLLHSSSEDIYSYVQRWIFNEIWCIILILPHLIILSSYETWNTIRNCSGHGHFHHQNKLKLIWILNQYFFIRYFPE